MFRGLRRFWRAVSRPFRAPEPPRPVPEQPRPAPEPSFGDQETQVPAGQNESNLRDTWQYVTGENRYASLFDDYLEIYNDTGMSLEESQAEYERLWDKFLRAFWLNSGEDGSVPRDDWYEDANVPKDRIDWEHWREVKKTP